MKRLLPIGCLHTEQQKHSSCHCLPRNSNFFIPAKQKWITGSKFAKVYKTYWWFSAKMQYLHCLMHWKYGSLALKHWYRHKHFFLSCIQNFVFIWPGSMKFREKLCQSPMAQPAVLLTQYVKYNTCIYIFYIQWGVTYLKWAKKISCNLMIPWHLKASSDQPRKLDRSGHEGGAV